MLSQQKSGAAMRIRDMTQGEPLRLIFGFAVPLLIGNIFQQIYTIADTMVVGHNLGDSAIAAIGATSSLYYLLINFANGLNSGCGIVVTRCFGAHDERGLKRAVAGMMVLDLSVTAALTALALLFLRPLLRYMNTPAEIFEQAYIYIAVICGGMVTTICYNMFAAILRAVGNSRAPLVFLMISCCINIVLDILFVAGLRWGLAGAAIATVAAQLISAALCGIYLLRGYRAILPGREDFRLSRALLGDLFSSGFAMALMLCVVDIGSTIFQRATNLLGESIITAHTASRRIMGIMMQPIGTIATANSTFVGQNWGAKKTDRIRNTLKKVIGAEVLWSVFACTVIYLFGSVLVRFTTGTADSMTIARAVMSLRIHFSCFPALAVLLCLRTAMQAMGQKTAPVISSFIELMMKVLSAWWLIPRLGFLGTSMTEPVTWVLMAAFLTVVYWMQREKIYTETAERKTSPKFKGGLQNGTQHAL